MTAKRLENQMYRSKDAEFQEVTLDDGPLKGETWEITAGVLGIYLPGEGVKRHHYRCRDGKWIYEPRKEA